MTNCDRCGKQISWREIYGQSGNLFSRKSFCEICVYKKEIELMQAKLKELKNEKNV